MTTDWKSFDTNTYDTVTLKHDVHPRLGSGGPSARVQLTGYTGDRRIAALTIYFRDPQLIRRLAGRLELLAADLEAGLLASPQGGEDEPGRGVPWRPGDRAVCRQGDSRTAAGQTYVVDHYDRGRNYLYFGGLAGVAFAAERFERRAGRSADPGDPGEGLTVLASIPATTRQFAAVSREEHWCDGSWAPWPFEACKRCLDEAKRLATPPPDCPNEPGVVEHACVGGGYSAGRREDCDLCFHAMLQADASSSQPHPDAVRGGEG
jgi:hypothetical protein